MRFFSLCLALVVFAGNVRAAGTINMEFSGTSDGSISITHSASGSGSFEMSRTGVVSDGEIGSINSGQSASRVNNKFYWTHAQPTTAGIISYCHVYLNAGATTGVSMGVYLDDGTLQGSGNTTPGTTDTTWVNVPITPNVTLTAGTEYNIGVVTDSTSFSLYHTATSSYSGAERRAKTMTYSASLSNQSATYFTDTGTMDFNVSNEGFTIICDNSAADPN